MAGFMRIAVVGGTGLTGGHVVAQLLAAEHRVAILARSRGVDLMTGRGLDTALAGIDVTIDVTSVTTVKRKESVNFFTTAGSNLFAAADKAWVRHHIVLSIVGVDRVRYGYYDGKLRQEELVREAPIPWTILRATQFHEFADQFLARIPGPFALGPRMRTQPIAVAEVAQHLVDLAGQEPQQMAPELAGPRVELLSDMVRRLLHARGQHRPVVPLWIPGAGFRAIAEGGLLPERPGPRGKQNLLRMAGRKVSSDCRTQTLTNGPGAQGHTDDGA
jgi:uncharacterized protein YbjT (DUF2867 family)